ncbi:MAG TPA: hypothetical protein VHE30_28510 [Polyangiaceae bacterium]|nr:hypothetical protein [Polyangiaceae bacterium]
MLARTSTIAFVCLVVAACASKAPEKSTGTNWIDCRTDADCAPLPGTRCGSDSRCVALDGGRASSVADSGRPSNDGSASGTLRDAAGPSDGAGRSSGPPDPRACYSPGQNLEHAYEPNAVGCRCTESQAPNGLCIGDGSPPTALVCTGGHWHAVDRSMCDPCWTPDQPDRAEYAPDNGCACSGEPRHCIESFDGWGRFATCTGGKWTLSFGTDPCLCVSDAECGFGGKCTAGACESRVCNVDGVIYAQNLDGIPSPTDDCNTCLCTADALGCTRIDCGTKCLPTELPTQQNVCGITTYGCFPICSSTTECLDDPILDECDTVQGHCKHYHNGPCL